MCLVDSQIDRGESEDSPGTDLAYFFIYYKVTGKWVRFAGGGGVALLPWWAVPQQAVGYRVVERLVDISLY